MISNVGNYSKMSESVSEIDRNLINFQPETICSVQEPCQRADFKSFKCNNSAVTVIDLLGPIEKN